MESGEQVTTLRDLGQFVQGIVTIIRGYLTEVVTLAAAVASGVIDVIDCG